MNHQNAQTSMSLFGYVAVSREEGCTHVCVCICSSGLESCEGKFYP